MDGPNRKIRIGEAAAAIGVTSKSLRQWLSRYGDKGLKPSADQTGTWLEFSFGDVAALSITKYLVDLGMASHDAFNVAMAIVMSRWPCLFLYGERRPYWTLNNNTAFMCCYITRNGEWGFGSFEHSEIRGIDRDGRVTIIINVQSIIQDAFAALGEMGHSLPRWERQGDVLDDYGNVAVSDVAVGPVFKNPISDEAPHEAPASPKISAGILAAGDNIIDFQKARIHALTLKELKVHVHTKTDAVLLRARTGADEIWFSLARSDFIELAKYLAKDAAEMMSDTKRRNSDA